MLPCKHILSVFETTKHTWKDLGERYTTSPFFNLDPYIVNGNLPEEPLVKEDHSELNEHSESDRVTVITAKDIPVAVYSKRTKASSCRDYLNEIKRLTYLIYDREVLDSLEEELYNIVHTLESKAPQDEGLIIEQHSYRNIKPSSKYPPIPSSGFRKSKLTGRVGEGVGRKRAAAANVQKILNLPTKSKQSKIEESLAEFNVNDTYDVPMNVVQPSNDVKDSVSDIDGCVDDDDNDEIEYLGTTVNISRVTVPSKRSVDISDEEIYVITHDDMLTDESINICQMLLKKQFSQFAGFFDTVSSTRLETDHIFDKKPYIQILHCGYDHWICVANVDGNSRNNTCYVFNSLCDGAVPHLVVTQIASALACKETVLNFQLEPVQQQRNGVDCGPFSVAFATSLAFRKDPTKITFDDKKLRSHLLQCIKAKKMSPFPQRSGKQNVLRNKPKLCEVELFCCCRMPYEEDRGADFDMAECSRCKEWYHRICENIPSKVFDNKRMKWRCSDCENLI